MIYKNLDKILFRRFRGQDTINITRTSSMRGESFKLHGIASSKAETPFRKASLNALIKIKL